MSSLQSFIGFLLGFAVAWIVLRWAMRYFYNQHTKDKPEVRKERAVKWMQSYGEITNDKYQELYGVSDAQATRDLDDLEKQGKIEQIGERGRFVTYKLKD